MFRWILFFFTEGFCQPIVIYWVIISFLQGDKIDGCILDCGLLMNDNIISWFQGCFLFNIQQQISSHFFFFFWIFFFFLKFFFFSFIFLNLPNYFKRTLYLTSSEPRWINQITLERTRSIKRIFERDGDRPNLVVSLCVIEYNQV